MKCEVMIAAARVGRCSATSVVADAQTADRLNYPAIVTCSAPFPISRSKKTENAVDLGKVTGLISGDAMQPRPSADKCSLGECYVVMLRNGVHDVFQCGLRYTPDDDIPI